MQSCSWLRTFFPYPYVILEGHKKALISTRLERQKVPKIFSDEKKNLLKKEILFIWTVTLTVTLISLTDCRSSKSTREKALLKNPSKIPLKSTFTIEP